MKRWFSEENKGKGDHFVMRGLSKFKGAYSRHKANCDMILHINIYFIW